MLELFSADIFFTFFKAIAHAEVLCMATGKSTMSHCFSPATTLFELSLWAERPPISCGLFQNNPLRFFIEYLGIKFCIWLLNNQNFNLKNSL